MVAGSFCYRIKMRNGKIQHQVAYHHIAKYTTVATIADGPNAQNTAQTIARLFNRQLQSEGERALTRLVPGING